MNTITADVRPAKIAHDQSDQTASASGLPDTLPAALALYHEQCEQLEAATDQDEIDRLVNDSQDTLIRLSGLTAPTAALLAAKLDAMITRRADFGTVDLDFLRDVRDDACHLASEPTFAKAWVAQWHDLGCYLIVDPRDGSRSWLQPDPHVVTDRHTGALPPHLGIYSDEEARGAAKALLTMLRLAGPQGTDAVFAFADTRKEG